jgi:hypothetical protein
MDQAGATAVLRILRERVADRLQERLAVNDRNASGQRQDFG